MASLAGTWVKTPRREASNAFDRLFLAEYSRVVAIALRVLGDAHEAEDVAQDVFCAFHRQHPADSPFAAAWLYRAAAHGALNTVRGRRRRERRETAQAQNDQRLQDSYQASSDPQRAVEDQERRAQVQAALSRLSEKSASILILRYSGLSYSEVATALGISAGQIGTLLRRAEQALRKELVDEARI